jgi:hypothetical protein
MKLKIYQSVCSFTVKFCLITILFLSFIKLNAQDSSAVNESQASPAKAKVKPVKNTFESIWIIDNQTVMVPIKRTLEFDFQHRMATINRGSKDLWGLYGEGANIRLGVNYTPKDNLSVGIGITKIKMLLDLNAKYSIIKQTGDGQYPVSVTWYGNAAVDTRPMEDVTLYNGEPIKHNSDRYSYFNEIIIARKINDKLSIQVAPSWSHQNAVWGYYTSYDTASKTYGDKYKSMNNEHFAVSVSGRYKFSNLCSVLFNYDQPLTKHNQYNPNPNLSLGLEVNTGSHTFQVFLGNYNLLNPQQNNMYNQHNPFKEYTDANGKVHKGYQYQIGFNITRLWNY